jgi:transcriptional regulator with XRE-family HTH domain
VNDQVPLDIGAELRHARELCGLSLRNIADITKLPVTSLKALEENRITHLPGGIYRRAIVRAYAGEVGLDPTAMLQKFLSQHPDDVPTAAPVTASARRPLPRLVHAAMSVLGATVPMFAGAFYFASGTEFSQSPRHIVDLTSSAPAAVSTAIGDVHSLAMMISVSSTTRLAVIADGREVVARQLEPGEVIRLNAADDVVLMGDNAGAVQFSINGRAGRTLGGDGDPLSARILRDDYLSWLSQR